MDSIPQNITIAIPAATKLQIFNELSFLSI